MLCLYINTSTSLPETCIEQGSIFQNNYIFFSELENYLFFAYLGLDN